MSVGLIIVTVALVTPPGDAGVTVRDSASPEACAMEIETKEINKTPARIENKLFLYRIAFSSLHMVIHANKISPYCSVPKYSCNALCRSVSGGAQRFGCLAGVI